MRSYLSLIPISARVHRRQSRLTRICIILAVFLVTSIFSTAEMATEGQISMSRRKHGDWHIAIQNVSEDGAEQIRNNPDTLFFSWSDEINTNTLQIRDYYVGEKNAAIYGVEETYVGSIWNYPAEGTYPQNETEVAVSADAKELFRIHVGNTITLNTPAGDLEYTISGFYEDDTEFNDIIDGICVYMNRTAFDRLLSMNGIEPSSQFYIRFRKENGLKKRIADLKQQYNLSDDDVKENTAVLMDLGASSNKSVNRFYSLAAFLFVIILVAGVFMISSCMNSNVAQRTSFFGMMRCIGASKEQIMRFVRLEALNWCKAAIPIGCALGTVTSWILCLILKFLVKGEWINMPLFALSIIGILSGAMVGVVTVFIAAHSPAKKAAGVSPVAAVSGNAAGSRHIVHAANTRFFNVETSLGIHHATEAKKNLFLMTGSFALMIVLFLAFSACLDIVNKLLPSVNSKFTPDVTIGYQDGTNSIDRNLSEEIAEMEGVESITRMMMYIAYPATVNGNERTIDFSSHNKELFDVFKKSVISGNLDKIFEDGNYAMAVYNQDNRLNVGDQIKIGDQELEIVCVTSEGIGSVSGAATVVCTEETYTRLTGETKFAYVGVILEKDAPESVIGRIQDLAADYPAIEFTDNREENSEINGTYWVFRLAVYGFLTIITLITVLNIMNSISMGVSARIKQYGAMRAVGMDSRQVTKMIAAEAATYAACGAFVGIILGLILHYLIYAKLVITHFGGGWEIPIAPIIIVILLITVSCVVAVYAPAKRIRNMAITETINEL